MAFDHPSANYFLLYEHDHANRALALAADRCEDVNATGRALPNLDTLTFWGHGTPGSLCGKNARSIVDIVKMWRSENPNISTVEVLTCNSRHAPGGVDPFVTQLRSQMGFMLRNVKIKSMPIRMGPGGLHGDSILFADYKTRTWCYVTTPSEGTLFSTRAMFKLVCEKLHGDNALTTAIFLSTPPPRKSMEEPPLNPFSKWCKEIEDIHDSPQIQGWLAGKEPQFTENFLKALNDEAFRREFIATRKYSVNYGTFEYLRAQLVTVR
jgi:hypothetical protein